MEERTALGNRAITEVLAADYGSFRSIWLGVEYWALFVFHVIGRCHLARTERLARVATNNISIYKPSSLQHEVCMVEEVGSDAGKRLATTIEMIRMRSQKNLVMHDLYLMLAAWNWPSDLVEDLSGAAPDQLRAYRNHEAEVPAELVCLVGRLWSLHWWLWLTIGDRSYADWWRSAIKLDGASAALPIEIVRRDGLDGIDRLMQHLKTWVLL